MSTSEPRPGTCPRCGTPVTRAFKFCPACACRLQPTSLPPPEVPRTNGRWLRALVLLTFGLLVAAVAAAGFFVFRPPSPPPASPGVTEVPGRLDGPLRVDDRLLRDMVRLDRRPAALTEWSARGAGDGEVEVEVRVDGYMRILRYEVTRGMYAQYIEDCQANPEHIPELIRRLCTAPEVPEPPELLPIPANGSDEEVEAIRAENAERLRPYRAAEALRWHGLSYIRAWWARLAEHLKQKEGRVVEPPRDFQLPLSEDWIRRILVPPTWVLPSPFEDYDAWEMPQGRGQHPENYPVTDVSWHDAEAFAAWATKRLGLPEDEAFRLPTWTEWMRAAHGGNLEYTYPWGTEDLVYACNNLNFWHGAEGGSLRAVDYRYSEGNFGQSPEHLWGMAGNAREWTRNDDWEQVDGRAERPEYLRVRPRTIDEELLTWEAPTMGGSFEEPILDCTITVASRSYRSKWERSPALGFRLYLPGYGTYNPLHGD